MRLAASNYSYELTDLDNLSQYNSTFPIDLNDEGTVLFSYFLYNYNTDDDGMALWNPLKGIQFLPTKDFYTISLKRLNNEGYIIGKAVQKDWPQISCKEKAVLWVPHLKKFITINPPNCKKVFLEDINDHNQVLGTFSDKKGNKHIFIYENGKFLDLKIKKQIIALGYDPLEIKVFKINNKGDVIGEFSYSDKDPSKEDQQQIEKFYFFWDGNFHIINRPGKVDSSDHVTLNDIGEVLIINIDQQDLWIWTKETGIEQLPLSIYEESFQFLPTLQGVDTSKYPGFKLSRIKRINKRKQILIEGIYKNTTHVFLLNPTSNLQESFYSTFLSKSSTLLPHTTISNQSSARTIQSE